MAADAQRAVHPHHPGTDFPAYRARGARHETGSVLAVHAGQRHVTEARVGSRARLDGEDLAPRGGLGSHLQVVLVHARDRAREAAHAAIHIEVEGVAHRATSWAPGASGATFLTAHSADLYPGKPEMGSR